MSVVLAVEAIHDRGHRHGHGQLDLASTLNNMAGIYRSQSKLEQALEFYQKSFDIKRSALGPDHPCLAGAHMGLGNVYHDLGEFEKALLHHRKAQEMYPAEYGEMHLAMAEIHQNMDAVYGSQGKLQQA